MRILGVILIVIGVLGLAWGGITYVKDRDSLDLGIAEITVEDKETIPIPPIVGVIALVAGAALLIGGRRGLSS